MNLKSSIKHTFMEDKFKLVGSLLESTTEYGKTSFELLKLQTLDKTSDAVSTIIPHSVVVILISSFMIFLNLGIALWLASFMGNIYSGFFIVAAFYLVTGLILHFFMHNWMKKKVRNFIIKQALK